MSVPVEQFIEGQRATWARGDYPAVAEHIQPVADGLVEAVAVEEGMTVLDVATGSGNVAIPAARHGARVTGLDLVPDFFETCRGRAAAEGLEIEWVEGNAEALPFEDAGFDRVLSVFGVMFAPRHDVAAAELVRVCKPGGVIGLCSWTPQGAIGQMFGVVSSHMPPPPEFVGRPPLWGTEDHVRQLLGDRCELEFERKQIRLEDEDSPESYLDWFKRDFGPLVSARALLGEERFGELENDLLELYRSLNVAPDAFAFDGEYLQVIARVK